MAESPKNGGKCVTCGDIIAKRSALKHIDSCILASNATKPAAERMFVIRVFDETGLFWVYLAVPIKNTLESLDSYIRDLWLECCGHLSLFKIDWIDYYAMPDPDYDDKSMDVRLNKVFRLGSTAEYEYDFGSTTELWFEVVREYGTQEKKDIELLIRNEAPDVVCRSCGKEATEVCSFCQKPSCEKCMKKDACENMDSFLPILNSPRTGQCGYTG